ncbi:MAG: primosomal protein N' [Oscillatoria princeps RMCB-10]|nr:primosomal protein N' [Oscillatoria princeps RMCB-10]
MSNYDFDSGTGFVAEPETAADTQWAAAGFVAEPGASYEALAGAQRWVEVLVDCPAVQKTSPEEEEKLSAGEEKLFTYRVPAELKVQPGDILSVPFGAQQLSGIAIRFTDRLPAGLPPERVRDVEDVIVAFSSLPPAYRQLLERVASHYRTPLIQVIRTALPPGSLARWQRRIRLNAAAIPAGADIFLKNPAARQILALLQASKTGNLSWREVQRQVKGAERGLQQLRERGWAESYLEQPKPPQPKRQLAAVLIGDGAPAADLTNRQREVLKEVLAVLRRREGAVWLAELQLLCKTTAKTLRALEQTGCFAIEEREVLRAPAQPAQTPDAPKNLTNHQQHALEVIANLNSFAQVLLHGVTGSGKTEVYLQAIAPVLQRGESALVLVPEIGLTPQLTDRFTARFGDKVSVYHSALSAGERYDTWRQMLQGEPQVLIGTRSAIFSPLPNLGLIVLDEEYDDSYKQDQPAPTYHARTVAKWRAELANCPLILGSATPSLETWLEIRWGKGETGSTGSLIETEFIRSKNSQSPNPQIPASRKTHYLSMPERIESRPMPPVEVVDMRLELLQGNRSIFSRSLQQALHRLFATRQQGILFIHRRGHSTFVSCRSCGYVIQCPNCDVSLAYHRTHESAAQLLRCHYCGYGQLHPDRCPECSSPYLKAFGSGTQRVEQELAKEFPQLRAIRFDSDTTQRKGAHRELLGRFANREADLLIGTQMLSKGLDLPQVTLVGVVAADGLLNMSDYRAAERAFQTLTQVAGRAGRGSDPGRVIIQTYTLEHPVIGAVRRHEYERFVEGELLQRSALNYPPYGRLILLRLSGLDLGEVESCAQLVAQALQPASLTPLEGGYELLGPAPAPVMRVANRYRWQILLKFPPRVPVVLPDLGQLRALCPPSVSLAVDVDPLNLG